MSRPVQQTLFQLAALRFILGVAEAGFFPGLILYITFWFREKELARAIALFMAALAVSNIIGAPVSTWIIDNIAWARDQPAGAGFSSSKGYRPLSLVSSRSST